MDSDDEINADSTNSSVEELCTLLGIKHDKSDLKKQNIKQSSIENIDINALQIVLADDCLEDIQIPLVVADVDQELQQQMIVNDIDKVELNTVEEMIPENNNRVIILSDITINSSDDIFNGNLLITRKRNAKVNKKPKTWQKNKNKQLRMEGQPYLGYRRDRKVTDNNKQFKVKHDVFRAAKTMKPICNSAFCMKSKLRSCSTIHEEKRKLIFEMYWKNMNWEQRRQYICSHVRRAEKKITKNPNSRRKSSLSYFFVIDNVPTQVCKKNIFKYFRH